MSESASPAVAGAACNLAVACSEVSLLEDRPLEGKAAEKDLVPADFTLFADEEVIAKWEEGKVNRDVIEPGGGTLEEDFPENRVSSLTGASGREEFAGIGAPRSASGMGATEDVAVVLVKGETEGAGVGKAFAVLTD